MKKIIFFAVFLMSTISVFAQAEADEIIGIWEMEDKSGKMEVFQDGNQYKAKLLWGEQVVNADGSSKKDVNNVDKNLRSRDLVGSTMIKGLVFDGDEEWNTGEVYNNANGKWYKCYVEMEKGQLLLTGYLGFRWLGQTSTWNRVNR